MVPSQFLIIASSLSLVSIFSCPDSGPCFSRVHAGCGIWNGFSLRTYTILHYVLLKTFASASSRTCHGSDFYYYLLLVHLPCGDVDPCSSGVHIGFEICNDQHQFISSLLFYAEKLPIADTLGRHFSKFSYLSRFQFPSLSPLGCPPWKCLSLSRGGALQGWTQGGGGAGERRNWLNSWSCM